MSIIKKNVFLKIDILQSVILTVNFLLELFNAALSASVFYTKETAKDGISEERI